MAARMLPPSGDPIRPLPADAVALTFDGAEFRGTRGQTIAGVLLGSGVLSWRVTSGGGKPRGVFCGIGVCFDCVVVVNGQRDVRACQRRAADADIVTTQHDPLPVRPIGPEASHD